MGVIFKNNVMYGAGDIEISPICYSEEEREIGVWTDGKPLYQKTFDIGAFPNTTTKSFAHNIANIDTIWVYDGFAYGSAGSYSLNRVTNNLQYQWETRVDDTYIYLQDFANFSNDFSAKVVLRYTKTTDAPGSGSWTPGGVPAVHYSEEEQVVGTWIDGKTIYQKTLTYTNQTQRPSDWTTLETFSDIDQVIKIDGFIDVSNGQRMSNQYYFRLVFQNNALKYYCAELAAGNGNITATIQYTKSTS